MDQQLRQLKRQIVTRPNDVVVLQRYIRALERVVGHVEPAEIPKRHGWVCPNFAEPDHEKWCWQKDNARNAGKCKCEQQAREWEKEHPRDGLLGSPDGVCIHDSEKGEGEHAGRQIVRLMIDGDWVIHPLPESYTGDNESEDWCIFCGHPDERK